MPLTDNVPGQVNYERAREFNMIERNEAIAKAKVRATRFNTGKPRWSLVHFKSLIPLVRSLEFGARKYDPENWKKGLNKKELLESIQRHLAAMFDGEEIDKESGISHIGHIQCNAMFYVYMLDNNLGNEEVNYGTE